MSRDVPFVRIIQKWRKQHVEKVYTSLEYIFPLYLYIYNFVIYADTSMPMQIWRIIVVSCGSYLHLTALGS
jgi:hypothetical protein